MDRTGGRSAVPVGAVVVAANGETLGTVHTAHPHYFVIQRDGSPPTDYEVPMHAVVAAEGGRVELGVNLEALTQIPAEEQSAAHRLHLEE